MSRAQDAARGPQPQRGSGMGMGPLPHQSPPTQRRKMTDEECERERERERARQGAPTGSLLDRYILRDELGRGSFGVVFRGWRKEQGQRTLSVCAIKAIEVEKMGPRARNASLQEAHLLAKLPRFPYILQYWDSFAASATPGAPLTLFIVTEYCQGGDLKKLLDRQRSTSSVLPHAISLKWAAQICLGLAFLHSRRIIHRDVKSMNIFLATSGAAGGGAADAQDLPPVPPPPMRPSRDTPAAKDSPAGQEEQSMALKWGCVRLGDLGVARVLADDSINAMTLIGTPCYMAPEIIQEKPYDAKTDIWALGCLFHEMCTQGRPAFPPSTAPDLLARILHGKRPPLSFRDGPEELRACEKLCVRVEPNERPTCEQLLVQGPLVSQMREHSTPEILRAAGLPDRPAQTRLPQLQAAAGIAHKPPSMPSVAERNVAPGGEPLLGDSEANSREGRGFCTTLRSCVGRLFGAGGHTSVRQVEVVQ